MESLLRKIDCHSLPVPDLEQGVEFYSSLGHELIWKDDSAAGLRLPEGEAELVLHIDDRPIETDFTVDSVPDAIEKFQKAGGKLVYGPVEIRIGKCAVLLDPWDNPIVTLDNSKGLLEVDDQGNMLGNIGGI